MSYPDMMPSPFPSLEEIGVPITAEIPEGQGDLIPGLLPLKGQLVVAGETNVGKSLLALEITSSLITGNPLWGELQPTKTVRKVLYLLGEHYVEVIQRLARVTELPFSDQVLILGPEQLGWDRWLVVGGKLNVQSLKKMERWLDGVDFVVFDPLTAFVSGVDIENDNVQMRSVLQAMNDLAHAAGASCLVLAHQGKPSMGKDGQEHSRKSYAIRGASAIEDAATNIFYMGRAPSGDSQVAKSMPGNYTQLHLTKRKYKGLAPNEYRLLRHPDTLVHTLLGNRPFAELMSIDRQAKLGRLHAAFPGMPMQDAVKVIAAIQGVSESTVARDIGVKS